jgi:hypothetical protein
MKAGRSILWGLAVIVVISPSLELGGSSKDHAMTVFTSYDTLVDQTPTPLPWTYLLLKRVECGRTPLDSVE